MSAIGASSAAAKSFRGQLTEAAPRLRLALRLLWRTSPMLTIGIAALLVLQAVVAPLQLALSRATIDRLALDLAFAPPAKVGGAVATVPLAAWLGLTLVALAAGYLLQPLANTLQALAGDRVTGAVTERLVLVANSWHGLARFEDPDFADDLARARNRAAGSGLVLLIVASQLGLTLLTAATAALVLARLHPLLALGLVAVMVPEAAQVRMYQERLGRTIYAQTPDTRRLEYARNVLLTPEAGKDVRLFALCPYFRRHYDAIFGRTVAALDDVRRGMAAHMAAAGLLSGAAAGAVYVLVVWWIARGERTLGDLALYGGAATLLRASVSGAANAVGIAAESFAFLPSLARVLDAPPDLPALAAGRARPVPTPIRHGVAFEHVAFAYPGAKTPVLRDVSFRIAPGECVALVGRNGAGKTTVVKLLLRLYDPSAGRVLVDGADMRDYDPVQLRTVFGVVFQDFVRYELTAGENVGVGRVDALGDDKRLLAAAARAGAADLVRTLPQGLHTPLGRAFGGRELSGGEWQKLALARAFVRDAQVLVLDEPTAALDIQTEFDLYLRLRELTRGKATLLISHRFSTVRMADRILVLADGAIREEGSHEHLMAHGEEYARLYQLQAAQYHDADDAGRYPTSTGPRASRATGTG